MAIFPLAAFAGIGLAADPPKQGTYDFTTCWTRNVTLIEYAPGKVAWSYDEKGTAVTSPRGGPFDGDEIRCVGARVSIDGKPSGDSGCIATSADGSKRFTRLTYDAAGKLQPQTVGGTGRYDGLAMTGTIETTKPPPPPQAGTRTVEYCNRNVGTYTMK
ncbi:MAG: hypothetical protein ACM3X5_06685 [Bacillota bacterium]